MRVEERMITHLDSVGMKCAAEDRISRTKGLSLPTTGVNSANPPPMSLRSFEDLLKIDEQREKDGFPKRIKIRRVVAAPGKIIVVPYVEEGKLIHGDFEPQDNEEGELGEVVGSGNGEVGDVIGQVPIHGEGDGGGDGDDPRAGEEEGEHGIETEAYKVGRELSENFQLPNLKDKGKKVPTDEYTYDLTDRHRGSGQLLDKKATLKSVIKTNIALGRIDRDNIDTANLIVGPKDKIYRVPSKEQVWKSQAIVIFLRDYSGSMYGEPTKAVISQHLMIYAWLMFQYEKMVIPRFFVHASRKSEAREVSAEDYFRLSASGGTLIASGYDKVNQTVDGESFARDFNIYLFQGTDGEDFDRDGRYALPEIEKILSYVNRMGVSVLKHPYHGSGETEFERYVKKADFPSRRDIFRMYVMSSEGVTEEDNVEAVKELIAQD